MVEFALILPLLALVVMMIVDFGRVFSVQIALTNAAREGARYCAQHWNEGSAATTQTNARVAGELSGTVAGATSSDCRVQPLLQSGAPMTVTVTAPFTLITPLICEAIGCTTNPGPPVTRTITIRASATMAGW
jgi:Flp pilus assembly protein TadG